MSETFDRVRPRTARASDEQIIVIDGEVRVPDREGKRALFSSEPEPPSLGSIAMTCTRCEARSVNEHILIEGSAGHLESDFIHEDRKDISRWIANHNAYATREAAELFNETSDAHIEATLFGSQAERKRWIRYKVWNRLPPLVRPFAYFSYRYFARGGVLDGKEALIFHVMQALWFPLLIDAKYIEMMRKKAGESR